MRSSDRNRLCAAALLARRIALGCQLPQRQRRGPGGARRSPADAGESSSSRPAALEPARGFELGVRGAAGADEVGVVGVREAVRPRVRRPDDGSLLRERARRRSLRPRPGRRRSGRCPSHRQRLLAPAPTRSSAPSPAAAAATASAPRAALAADLEVRRRRGAHRAGREQRAPKVGGAAAGAPENRLRGGRSRGASARRRRPLARSSSRSSPSTWSW